MLTAWQLTPLRAKGLRKNKNGSPKEEAKTLYNLALEMISYYFCHILLKDSHSAQLMLKGRQLHKCEIPGRQGSLRLSYRLPTKEFFIILVAEATEA